MKKNLIFIIIIIIIGSYNIVAQTTKKTTITFDAIQAPASPGANLIGIAPTEIQKPTDVKAFALQFQNATSNFTGLPKNFAFDINLHSFLGDSTENIESFAERKVFKMKNIWQSFVISGAYRDDTTINSIKKSQLGIGFKVTLIRPKLSDDANNRIEKSKRLTSEALTKEYNSQTEGLNQIINIISRILPSKSTISKISQFKNTNISFFSITDFNKLRKDYEDAFPVKTDNVINQNRESWILLEKIYNKEEIDSTDLRSFNNDEISYLRYLQGNLSKVRDNIKTKQANEKFIEAPEIAKNIKFERKGFALDFSGGFVQDIAKEKENSTKSGLSKFAFWLTPSYSRNDKLTFLGIARYMHTNLIGYKGTDGKETTVQSDNLDIGARALYRHKDEKVHISVEAIHRNVYEAKVNSSTWRATFNIEYHFSEKLILSLVVGRDYDNSFIKSGNTISFLNLFSTFGKTEKTIPLN